MRVKEKNKKGKKMRTQLKSVIDYSGLKQSYIARRLGISEGLVSKYVTGRRPMPKHIVKAFAVVLGVPQKTITGAL